MSKQDESNVAERGDESKTDVPDPKPGQKSGTRIESKGVPGDDEDAGQDAQQA